MAEPFTLAWKYHSLNRCVIPSGGGEKGKSPILNTWTEYQARRSTDAELNGWNDNLHPKLWGMVTGPVSSIFVIDCDTPEACGMFDLAGMPPHVRTPRGGAHYYFRYPQFRIPNATGILPQIDVRGEGGFVNFAGGKYDVKIIPTDDAVYPMTRLPKQILAALQNGKAKTSARADKPIPAGERDQTLTSLAGTMRKKGMSISAMEAALLTVNQEQCDPPMPEADVIKIARSVGRYEPEPPKPKIEKVIPTLKLTMQAGVYDFTWDNYIAKLSRVKDARDRTVGELKIIVNNSEPATLLQRNLNLLAGRSIREVAKELEGKSPSYDWDAILEQICTQTIELMRGGDPALDLVVDQLSTLTRPEYVLYPVIVRRMPNCLFGDPGTLKSTTALLFSQIAGLQWAANPLGLRVGEEPMRGLLLDWETDEDTTTYQLFRMGKGFGFNVTTIAYRRCALPLHADLEQVCKYVLETKADYIIIDSLAMASGGEPKETEPALRFFGALRQIKTHYGEPITSLTLAHNSKNAEEKRRSIYGNMQYTAQMRNIWESVKRSEEGDDEIDIALFHRKPPPFGKVQHAMGWKYVFDDQAETISVQRSDPRSVEEFVERMGTEQRILNCLSGGMQTHEQLADRLSVKDGTLRSALSRLAKKGRIQSVGKGWGLKYE